MIYILHVAGSRDFAIARKPGRFLPISGLTATKRMPGSFFDTNILLHLASQDDRKADRAEALLEDGGAISVQVLNEFANVARRKMGLSWLDTRTFLSILREVLAVQPITIETHETSLAVAERYNLSLYDAMVVASALHCGCSTLWSEDIQHGLVIEGRLRVSNPFRQNVPPSL